MKTNTRVKRQAIRPGDDVKHIVKQPTPGARAGVATARAINRSIGAVTYAVTNVADFATHLWKGRLT